jgi:polyribonucleotide 5'-hydroxyl-kinase
MTQSTSCRPFSLPALHEYRFELEPSESITIKLISGTAEVSGLELTSGQEYSFGDEIRSAIFSWHGADLEIRYSIIYSSRASLALS